MSQPFKIKTVLFSAALGLGVGLTSLVASAGPELRNDEDPELRNIHFSHQPIEGQLLTLEYEFYDNPQLTCNNSETYLK